METTTKIPTISTLVNLKTRYGITEKKKAELDQLTLLVLDTQLEVNQSQAIVTSLTAKVTNFQGYLTAADGTREETFNNRALMTQLVQSALELKKDSKSAFKETQNANGQTIALSKSLKVLIDQLIYSADMLNKLSNIIIRKKALNPLISDDLVSMIATAGKDANTAVSLTLVALKSTFAAEASNIESVGTAGLAYSQAELLYQTLTDKVKGEEKPLKQLIDEAYKKANARYKRYEYALKIATKQLNEASINLNTLQITLASYQAALAAGNAAALA